MDLDKYKKAWDNQPIEANKVSKVDIYKMAHSKSSSIVKWIFVIGILEFLFWFALNFFIPDNVFEIYKDLNILTFVKVYMIIHYIIIIAFLFIFYKNYRRISIIENTKTLIKRILQIRKTVKYYVYYNLITVLFSSIIVNGILFSDTEKLVEVMNPKGLAIDINQLVTITIISQIIGILIILGLLWLFYRVVYGILLRKLKHSHKELSKLEDLN